MLAVQALTMPVRCRRASSGAQRCKPMKPKCTDEAEICESEMAPVSMPSGMAQAAGGGQGEVAVRWPPEHAGPGAPENNTVWLLPRPRAETSKGLSGPKKRCMVRKAGFWTARGLGPRAA